MTTLWPEQRLQEVEARCRAATRAPLRAEEIGGGLSVQYLAYPDLRQRDAWKSLATIDPANKVPVFTRGDAQLFAHARTDLADAVAEIRRLQARLGETERHGGFCASGHFVLHGETHFCSSPTWRNC